VIKSSPHYGVHHPVNSSLRNSSSLSSTLR
jgi:hypothetical protein